MASSNPTEATAGPGGFISCAPTATGGAVTISSTFGGATGTSTVVCDGPVISAAAITPQDASAPVGGVVQFNAVITFSDGTKCDSTANAFWQTGDPSVATIATGASAGGLATAHAVGSTLVQAAIHGVQAPPATLVVTAVTDGGSGDDAAISDASAPDGGSPVTSIVVLPSNPSLPLDCPQQMTAVAQHADGTTNDATTASTWSSSPTGIVAIDPTGFLHCSAVGTTEVSASCGGRTGQTAVTCTATTLVSLNVVPPDAAIAVGSTLQYAANGLYSSGQECDLTRAAQWQSSSASVASIVTGTPDAGLATALEAGTTQISAASGAITGTATLTVQ